MAKAPKTDAAWAVETLRTTLEAAGHTLQSAEVIYKKLMLWGDAKARLFLVRYLRGDGYASVGCVGPFVRLLDDLPMTDIETLMAKTVNRRLLELYIGQFFIDRAARDATHPCTMTAADIEAAFSRYRGDVGISRRGVTKGADNLNSTWATSLPAKFCTLACHAEPVGLWLEGQFHLIAPVTIAFDLSRGGTSTEYGGPIEISQPYYFRTRDTKTIDYPIVVSDRRVSFPAHRLANVIGSIYGPGEILDKWGWAHLRDI